MASNQYMQTFGGNSFDNRDENARIGGECESSQLAKVNMTDKKQFKHIHGRQSSGLRGNLYGLQSSGTHGLQGMGLHGMGLHGSQHSNGAQEPSPQVKPFAIQHSNNSSQSFSQNTFGRLQQNQIELMSNQLMLTQETGTGKSNLVRGMSDSKHKDSLELSESAQSMTLTKELHQSNQSKLSLD